MLASVASAALSGLEGHRVDVEADVVTAAPSFSIVGLPDAAVQESRERVRAAIVNSAYEFPSRRITVNLAPADLRKEGPSFDLPVALARLHDDLGARLVLCEGGATLNGLLLEADLVDEWCLTLAPTLVGGDAVRAAHGTGGAQRVALRLDRAFESDGELLLRYVRAEDASG